MRDLKNQNQKKLKVSSKNPQKILRFLQNENLDRLLIFIALLIIVSGLGLSWAEPHLSFIDAVWWSIVTLATVGYGDIAPTTLFGRLIAVVNMFIGIGLLATFSATMATILIGRKMKDYLGMGERNLENHTILCGWNYRARVILNELSIDTQNQGKSMVLIADIERKPLDEIDFFFIKGQVCDETLHRANLVKAKTVIILGDDSLEDTARDAKAILSTLTVESINPDAYTIVELVDQAYVKTCKRANADEIIVSSDLSSMLISQAALNHGITKVIYEILRSENGNQLYKVPVPKSKIGLAFIDVLIYMKQTYQSIVLAVQKGREGEVISNPPANYQLENDDYLILMATEKPRSS